MQKSTSARINKFNDVARIELLDLRTFLRVEGDAFVDAVAVAGWANHGACAAAQTLATPLAPDIRLELYVEKIRQIARMNNK